jgi:glyoxylase-like metal-dependent hydrolase (beta-lactamase superfamily II)
VTGEVEVWPGIRVLPTPGHTPHHQSLLLESDGARLFYPADLMPTSAHIPLPWIMGYDVEPLRTLESKRAILKRAVDEDWLLVFEHDARVTSGRVMVDGKGYGLSAEGKELTATG